MNRSIEKINEMGREKFVELLSEIYEQTPAVVEKAWRDHPFLSIADLHQKMAAIVHQMSEAEQLALIRAHPELGANVEMAKTSVQEQAGAGLNQMREAERKEMKALNEAYRRKFSFPFVMAVKGYGTAEILSALEARLGNEVGEEKARSLQEINKIARLRLEALISQQ